MRAVVPGELLQVFGGKQRQIRAFDQGQKLKGNAELQGQSLLASQLTIYRSCLSRGLTNGHKETIHTHTHTQHTHKGSANSHSNSQSPAPQSDETAKPATELQ